MTNRNWRLCVVCVGLLSVNIGCSSAPQTHHYLLLHKASSGADKTEQRSLLSTIELPDYLRQQNIVLKVGAHEVRPSNFHLWAEPLEIGIARILESWLAQTTHSSRIRSIDVHVLNFLGSLDGEVRLDADWSLSHACGTLAGSFGQTLQLAQDGYAALVATHVELVQSLGMEIMARHGEISPGCPEE